jgi:uncharacterized protein (DUF433 family)
MGEFYIRRLKPAISLIQRDVAEAGGGGANCSTFLSTGAAAPARRRRASRRVNPPDRREARAIDSSRSTLYHRATTLALMTAAPNQPPPPLSSEDELAALLLAMVLEHCQGYSPEAHRAGLTPFLAPGTATLDDLDSYAITANADAMRALHDDGLIEITHAAGRRIFAKVTPEGRALLDRLRAERQQHEDLSAIDWTHCPDVESVPGRCSGAPVVKGTRVLVQGILDNAADCSVAEIAEMFELPVDPVRRILAYAGRHA